MIELLFCVKKHTLFLKILIKIFAQFKKRLYLYIIIIKHKNMKATVIIKNVEHFENRSNVTLNISGYGDEYVVMCNKVTAICRKYNAQQNIYNNASHLKYDKEGNVIGFKNGNSGGTITFHSHSCDHKKAVEELLNEIEL